MLTPGCFTPESKDNDNQSLKCFDRIETGKKKQQSLYLILLFLTSKKDKINMKVNNADQCSQNFYRHFIFQ